jgi:lipopolysaccharide heptosyltransferase II
MCRWCFIGKFIFIFKKRKLPKQVKKVLFLKVGAIGDVLMTTPLLHAISKAGYNIDYCVGNFAAEALKGNKDIGNLIVFDTSFAFRKKLIPLLKLAVKIRKRKYDLIFVLDKSWLMAVFAFLCGKFRIGFDRFGEGFANNLNVKYQEVKHEIKYYLELAKFLNIKSADTNIRIALSKKDADYAKTFFKKNNLTGKKVVGIIPGGAKNIGAGDEPVRRWPVDRFIELSRKLIQKEYYVILLGGPDDFELNEHVRKAVNRKIFNAAVGTIKQAAALMRKCRYIVCNDSGPMHLASAVNKHIISIFGPTNPARKAPLHKESKAIWKDQDIYEKDYELFGRAPKRKDFMKKIEAGDVLKYIK